MVLDTGRIYAALDRDDAAHDAAYDAISAAPGHFVLSPFGPSTATTSVRRER
jgi:predicted nucleic acid-binding protein